MGMIKRGIGVLAVSLVACVVGVAPASALSPWWHLSSASRPTYLQSGQAKDETQEVKVNAEEGAYALVEVTNEGSENFEKFTILSTKATAAEIQAQLQAEVYGAGNVTVTGEAGGTYIVTFTGELAEQRVSPMAVVPLELSGGAKEVTVNELTKGRHDGVIVVTAVNLGDANADPAGQPVTIIDKLPPGLEAVGIEGATSENISDDESHLLECSLGSLSCTFTGKSNLPEYPSFVPPYHQLQMRIAVNLTGAKSGEVNEATVTGGGAPGVSAKQSLIVGAAPTPFGVSTYEMRPEEEGGGVATQAGSHPFQLTTTLGLNETFEGKPIGLAKDLHFKLPPGLIGNPTSVAQCSLAQFLKGVTGPGGEEGNECSAQSVVGVARGTINLSFFGKETLSGERTNVRQFVVPLFNIAPAVGEPARFGFLVGSLAGDVPVLLDTAVRTGSDYGVTVNVTNITQAVEFLGSEVTFWGVPGDERHDTSRSWECLAAGNGTKSATCPPLGERHPSPLLVLPTSCSGEPLQTTVETDPWRQEGSFQAFPSSAPLPTLDGCNRLQFNPSISVAPDGLAGSTPTGLAVAVHVPQDVSLNAKGLAEADVKNTTVALPAGVGLNSAGADGLRACSEEQVALDSHGPSSCPEASKVGIVKIKTPLLPNELEGAAYLASQDANPFGSLVALYVVAEDPVSGTTVKLAGEVVPNPVTGQLVSTFKSTPQLPFETFELHFFGGDRAPLSTPSLCGAYTTIAAIEPWTETGEVDSNSTFDVVSGPNGSPCRSPLPFSPSLTAGTTSIQAGGFSPFTMTMSRPDGSQDLQAIRLKMPPGLSGTLAKVKLCPEAQANAGTCGPESLIGHTIVSVGVGGDPYSVTGGEVFITEGYKGAPYGLSIVNPAKAGPFDLGKVIVRAKIEVDPLTADLTVTTDTSGPYKIPTILDGIPLQIQHVEVSIDRPGFTFNPTNCSPLQVTGNLESSQGATAAIKVPFQITNCAVLAFKPKLTAKTAGKTSRKTGASLTVKLTYPAGPYDANIAKVKVDLPKQLPSKLPTLQKACPSATFEANPAACPAASVVGHATATTPVLPVPLTGPAYFVSHGGEAFPDLVIVLQGYGVTVHLVGSTFINEKTNVTSSTFKAVPDVPVGTFELTLPQGQYSALAATANLCTTKLAMPTSFVGQNGAVLNTSTPITPTGCAKKKTTHKAKTTRNAKSKHKQKKK